MLLIFRLGRPDVLPVDDFGVREGYRVCTAWRRSRGRATSRRSARAGPPRSLAAWYLWRAADEAKQEKAAEVSPGTKAKRKKFFRFF